MSDTPRTDALCLTDDEHARQDYSELAQTLEHELAGARAEIERLEAQLKSSHGVLQFCLDQASEGAVVSHDCPAVFACTAIIAALDPGSEDE